MKTCDISDLTRSYIMYKKKEPFVSFSFSVFFFILFICIIVGSFFIKKKENITISGIITSSKTRSIYSAIEGKITSIYVNDGDQVKKNDILFKIDNTIILSKKISLESKIRLLEKNTDNFKIFITNIENLNLNFLEENKNPFTDGEFYIQYKNLLKNLYNVPKTKTSPEGIQINKSQEELIDERLSIVDQFKLQLYSEIRKYDYEIINYKTELDVLCKNLSFYTIKASIDGIVTFNNELNENDYIQKGHIGNISEKIDEKNSVVEVFIPSQNINNFNLDDQFVIEIKNNENIIKGKVIYISNDSFFRENILFYRAKIQILNKNRNFKIRNGQQVGLKIQMKEKTWIKWILNQIGINV